MALGVYGLTSTGEHGLTSVTSWVPMLVSGGVLVLLVRHERRIGDPLVPPELLRSRAVVGGLLTALAITATTSPAMFLCTLYVQQELQLSPVRASLLFPVFNIAVVGGSLLAPTLLRRFGARSTLLGGFGAMGAGCATLIAIGQDGHPIAYLVTSFALMGAGLGAASVASTQTGTEAVEVDQHGVVAGALTSAAQVGTALGLALTPFAIAAAGGPNYRAGFIGTPGGRHGGRRFQPARPGPRSVTGNGSGRGGIGVDTMMEVTVWPCTRNRSRAVSRSAMVAACTLSNRQSSPVIR